MSLLFKHFGESSMTGSGKRNVAKTCNRKDNKSNYLHKRIDLFNSYAKSLDISVNELINRIIRNDKFGEYIKKLLSVSIVILFLGQNIVYSQVNNLFTEINPNFNIDKSFTRNRTAKDTEYKANLKHVIKCDDNSNVDSICKYIEITKNKVRLNSYLKKNYNAYLYTLKNNSNKSIEIVKWNSNGDYINPNNAISGVKSDRISFKNAMLGLALSPIIDVAYVFSVVTVAPMQVMLAMCETEEDKFFLKTLPISIPVMCIWYAVSSPYQNVTGKIKDKKAVKDSTNLIKEYPAQFIEPSQQIVFSALVSKTAPCFDKFNFYFKDTSTSEVFLISK